ncbi:MAG: hypothetical protein JWM23_575 [Microbacteriaceae bacterium]|nr:hypothetical protein [Microbacteriaceae bacterium]
MSAVTKVLVEQNGVNVSVNVLTDRDGLVALNPLSTFAHIGTVREIEVEGTRPGTKRSVWQWSSEGFDGTAATKRRARSDMLADAGYKQVALEATIPPLFEVEL